MLIERQLEVGEQGISSSAEKARGLMSDVSNARWIKRVPPLVLRFYG